MLPIYFFFITAGVIWSMPACWQIVLWRH